MVFVGIQPAFGHDNHLFVSGTSKGLSESFLDQVTTLLSNVNARVLQLERSHEEDLKQMKEMQIQIEEMKTQNMYLKENMEDIKTENVRLKENMDGIKEYLSTVGLNLDSMLSKPPQYPPNSDTNTNNSKDFFLLKKSNNGNRTSMFRRITRERRRNVQTFKKIPYRRAVSVPENAAFHAVLDIDLVNPGKGYQIVFGQVLTNTGRMYSSNTGTFSCGSSGTYVFMWTVTLAFDHWTDTHLVRNGQVIGIIVAGNAYHYGSYSGTALVNLDVGDEVFVKVDYHQENTTIYSAASTFTGFKLF
ncbi:uncharacterized protein LOC132560199 [Ylistrum balloti]|uniref:uncharacterized protein LOC132560199 n=1 Tax=Ylistrum balloti TaxID=509963 RepID=UPI0029059405|nr:uncharacterized protein LOC132560199 [Ylistrum balloti]